jgi:PAS domain S-box-containing protein
MHQWLRCAMASSAILAPWERSGVGEDLSGTPTDPGAALLPAAVDGFTGHAFLTLDCDGLITSWSLGAERLFGATRADVVGQPFSLIFTAPDRAGGLPGRLLQRAEREGSVSGRRWLAHAGGNRRYVNATIVSLRNESGALCFAAVAHEQPFPADDEVRSRETLAAQVADATRRLSDSNTRLSAEIADRAHADAARMRLLRRLVAAEEEARRRIARDLHDDLGHQLTALRLQLQGLELEATRRAGAPQGLTQALEMVGQIDRGLDFLAWELRPAALDEFGLNKVLENYVREWSRHSGVPAMFHSGIADAERYAPELEASVYRIAQEALNNVAKHARALSVNVLLEQRGEHLVLVVEDDGIGVRATGSAERMIGLAGMRERAAAVGGTFEIEPTPHGGTTVVAHIPIAMTLQGHGSPGDWRVDAGVPETPAAGAAGGDADGAMNVLRSRLQKLQHAVAARDEFIATVAHELRNPVSPLIFQLRLAIEKIERTAFAGEPIPVDWAHGQLRRIEQHLHRLLETLDRLLDVSRLASGRVDLQLEPVNLAETVREVLDTFEAELAVARCPLTFAAHGEATGTWDRVRLEQVCRNLVSNAIRFGAGRPIDVSVSADEDFATLQVRDHGVGIAPEQHARIFERFEQAAPHRTGGFGIGLWVVRSVCAAMGGKVTVESEPGEGACFTVMLPRRSEQDAHQGKGEDN